LPEQVFHFGIVEVGAVVRCGDPMMGLFTFSIGVGELRDELLRKAPFRPSFRVLAPMDREERRT
jgi:hypothetical protein